VSTIVTQGNCNTNTNSDHSAVRRYVAVALNESSSLGDSNEKSSWYNRNRIVLCNIYISSSDSSVGPTVLFPREVTKGISCDSSSDRMFLFEIMATVRSDQEVTKKLSSNNSHKFLVRLQSLILIHHDLSDSGLVEVTAAVTKVIALPGFVHPSMP